MVNPIFQPSWQHKPAESMLAHSHPGSSPGFRGFCLLISSIPTAGISAKEAAHILYPVLFQDDLSECMNDMNSPEVSELQPIFDILVDKRGAWYDRRS